METLQSLPHETCNITTVSPLGPECSTCKFLSPCSEYIDSIPPADDNDGNDCIITASISAKPPFFTKSVSHEACVFHQVHIGRDFGPIFVSQTNECPIDSLWDICLSQPLGNWRFLLFKAHVVVDVMRFILH